MRAIPPRLRTSAILATVALRRHSGCVYSRNRHQVAGMALGAMSGLMVTSLVGGHLIFSERTESPDEDPHDMPEAN